MNSSLVGMLREAAEHDEIEGVYGALFGIQGLLDEALIDLEREDPTTIQNLSRTPAAALGSCRYRLGMEDCERALEILIDALQTSPASPPPSVGALADDE